MAPNATSERVSPADVTEGDRVVMVVVPHSYDHCGSKIEGTVYDAPDADDEWTRSRLREGQRLMVDFAIETDDGDKFRWNVDNGYVLGFHDGLGRRTDVAKFRRFEEP